MCSSVGVFRSRRVDGTWARSHPCGGAATPDDPVRMIFASRGYEVWATTVSSSFRWYYSRAYRLHSSAVARRKPEIDGVDRSPAPAQASLMYICSTQILAARRNLATICLATRLAEREPHYAGGHRSRVSHMAASRREARPDSRIPTVLPWIQYRPPWSVAPPRRGLSPCSCRLARLLRSESRPPAMEW